MKRVLKVVKHLSSDFLKSDCEEKNMLKFLKAAHLSSTSRILDVGCGYGRNMKLIKKHLGWEIEGVEINQHIVDENIKNGLRCCTVEEFQKRDSNEQYDCMIFSHIVEHFYPSDLKQFLEGYLKFLRVGGVIIVATPLLWKGFYWDFDHIKPYHPIGFNMVFGKDNAQVQYYGSVQLELQDIWFRKNPYQVHYCRGLYVKDWSSYICHAMNLLYAFLFKISFGVIGVTNGWMGMYKKIK